MKTKRLGFTLVEVLLYAVIFILVVGAIVSTSLNLTLESQQTVVREQLVDEANLVFDRLLRDVGSGVSYNESSSNLGQNFSSIEFVTTIIAPDGATTEDVLVDFETDLNGTNLLAGEWITTQFDDFTISVDNNGVGHPDKGIIFDTNNITGGDWDLQTPGYGAGNNTSLNNILIIAEDDVDNNSDGLVDDPDDENYGGVITLDFIEPVDTSEITIIDVEHPGNFMRLYDVDDNIIASVQVPQSNDNSVQVLSLVGENVKKFEGEFDYAAAMDNLRYTKTVIGSGGTSGGDTVTYSVNNGVLVKNVNGFETDMHSTELEVTRFFVERLNPGNDIPLVQITVEFLNDFGQTYELTSSVNLIND